MMNLQENLDITYLEANLFKELCKISSITTIRKMDPKYRFKLLQGTRLEEYTNFADVAENDSAETYCYKIFLAIIGNITDALIDKSFKEFEVYYNDLVDFMDIIANELLKGEEDIIKGYLFNINNDFSDWKNIEWWITRWLSQWDIYADEDRFLDYERKPFIKGRIPVWKNNVTKLSLDEIVDMINDRLRVLSQRQLTLYNFCVVETDDAKRSQALLRLLLKDAHGNSYYSLVLIWELFVYHVKVVGNAQKIRATTIKAFLKQRKRDRMTRLRRR